MIKKIFIGLIVVVGALLAYALTKPATFRVERRSMISAPQDVIQSYLVDFHKWTAWSPWEKLDPAMKRTYAGAEQGVGATYAWDGNQDAGKGKMEITRVLPDKVDIDLDFNAPMEARNKVVFQLQPQGSATEVIWTMSGENNFMTKLMQVFVSMDSLVGKDFEAGLRELKAVSEKAAAEIHAEQAKMPE